MIFRLLEVKLLIVQTGGIWTWQYWRASRRLIILEIIPKGMAWLVKENSRELNLSV